MKLPSFLGDRRREPPVKLHQWEAKSAGLYFSDVLATDAHLPAIAAILRSPEVGALLDQLVTEDRAGTADDAVVMDWEQVHELVRSPAYASSLPLLELPPALVDQRGPAPTRRHWGTIRRLAVEAGALLDEFLVRSVVVTPEKLDIQFRKTRVAGSPVVEISPGFSGAPERWLEYFDKTPSVPDHFNIPTKAGAVHGAVGAGSLGPARDQAPTQPARGGRPG